VTTERLIAAHKAAPFRPFTIHMVNSRAHRVDHPEFFNYRPGTRTAVLIGPKGEAWVLDTMLISEIEFDAPPDLPGRDPGATFPARGGG
jgi:hypothetical protein